MRFIDIVLIGLILVMIFIAIFGAQSPQTPQESRRIIDFDDIRKADYYLMIYKPNLSVSVGCGNSMYPFLKENDIMILQEINDSFNLSVGDIVCYKTKNICHRITNINDKIEVKGDDSDTSELINRSEIKYIVVGVLF